MAGGLDPEEAKSFMIESGLMPLEPYVNALSKWKCTHLECGEVVYPVYNQIRKGQSGCRNCATKKRSKASMLSSAEALKVMRDAGLEPLEDYSGTKSPWKCRCMKCGKTISPTYSAIKNGQGSCKYCSRRFVDAEDAIGIMINAGLEPLEPYSGAGKPWRSRCVKCGLVSAPRFANVQNGSGCISCKNADKINPRTLSHQDAVEIMISANMKPLVPYEGVKAKWKSKCLVCLKVTYPALGNVLAGHKACAYCTGRKVDPKDAELIMKKSKLLPLEPYKGADVPWKCECLKCGKTTNPSYASIKSGQGGCRSCGVKEGAKKHLLSEKEAEAVMLKAKLKPLEKYVKSDNPWKCRCLVCKKVVYPAYSNVNSGNSGCIYCVGGKVDEKDAIALMRKNGFEPLEPYIDNKKKWKSLHVKCGNVVYPLYNTIQNRGSGCSTCAEYGLTYTAPAYLYIMEHIEYGSIKVGISNDDATPNRVRSHQSEGWKHYKSFYFTTGQIAEDIENEVLNWLRNEKQLGIHLSKELMKQGGYSETVDAMEISVLEIEKFIKKILIELQD